MSDKKTSEQVKMASEQSKENAQRPYYGVQDPDYAEGGGFGRHRDTKAGESQEGSRNPSGHTVKPKVSPPSEKADSPTAEENRS